MVTSEKAFPTHRKVLECGGAPPLSEDGCCLEATAKTSSHSPPKAPEHWRTPKARASVTRSPRAQAPAWTRTLPAKLQLRRARLSGSRAVSSRCPTKRSFADKGVTKLELCNEGKHPWNQAPRKCAPRRGAGKPAARELPAPLRGAFRLGSFRGSYPRLISVNPPGSVGTIQPRAQAPAWTRTLRAKLQLRRARLSGPGAASSRCHTKRSFAENGMTKQELRHEGY